MLVCLWMFSSVLISIYLQTIDTESIASLQPNYAFLVTKKLRQRGISLIVGSSSSGENKAQCFNLTKVKYCINYVISENFTK